MENEDLVVLINSRINEHKVAEAAKLEVEQAHQQEEEAKAKAAAKSESESSSLKPVQVESLVQAEAARVVPVQSLALPDTGT